MEDLFLVSSPFTWFVGGGPSCWTREENKMFESALAVFDEEAPDRWIKLAAFIPGKSAWDVENKYRELLEDVTEIESGRIPLPGYLWGTFDLAEARDLDRCRKKPPGDHERKKGVPWTEEEHRRFLMGLLKYGKGDWRSISRNFVISKTPTQVASHAQKYFMRQLSGSKEKRRPSIHDITTTSLVDSPNSALDHQDHHPYVLTTEQKTEIARGLWINNGNLFPTDAFGLKPRERKLCYASFSGSMLGVRSRRHQAI